MRVFAIMTDDNIYRDSLIQLFLSLPNELHVLILCELDLQTVLSLRLASRSLNSLVASCESALVRYYTKNVCTALETYLYPPPGPNEATIHYLLNWKHRKNTSRTLSAQLCNFVSREILFRNTLKKRSAFQPTWNRMFQKLCPLIFTLNHFFESYRHSLLSRCIANSKEGSTFAIVAGPALWDDQMQIMDAYDPILLLDLYHCYGFLLQAFERKLRPPSYATGLERLLRGWTAKPATTQEIEVLLMLGGMDMIGRVLGHGAYNERRRALDAFIRALDPAANPGGWRSVWEGLGLDPVAVPLDRIPATRLGIPALHLIWVPNALNLLLAKEVIEHVDFGGDSSVRSTRDFVSDLVGWDILRYSSAPPQHHHGHHHHGGQTAAGGANDDSDEDEDEEDRDSDSEDDGADDG